MSRGLGILQRRAMLYLWRARPSGRAKVREVKRVMGPDRANNRRAIRSLMDRGLLEEREEDGTRLVVLTRGAVGALTLAAVFADGGELSEERVPSAPFDLDAVLAGLGEDDHDYGIVLPPGDNARSPHGPEMPSWFRGPSGGPRLSDNLSAHSGRPHGKQVTPCKGEASFDLPISDNDPPRQPSAMQRVLDALTEGLEEMCKKVDE